MSESKIIRKKILQGYVVSNKSDKTAIIEVTRRKQHPKYKKFINISKKYMVHDEKNQVNVGDFVRIVECRPLSRRKRWRLLKIVERVK